MNTWQQKLRYLIVQRLGSKIVPFIPSSFFRYPLPSYVIIEPTNICNLRCPLCPTNTAMYRKKGMMTISNFHTLADELAGFVEKIAFNFSGEPTLNPVLFDMVRYAEDKGMSTYISTNTTIIDKHLDRIFDSGLSTITVCLDGASKKNHEAYRVGSNFEKVKANIKKLTAKKRQLKSKKPYIELQFLVMKHNENDIPKMFSLARRLDVDALSLKTISLGSSISLKEKIARGQKYLPQNERFSRYTLEGGKLRVKKQPLLCEWPFRRSVIYWNGDVTTCCYDFNGKHTIGNIFDYGSFKKLWFSYAYALTRKKVLTHKLPLCKTCSLPTDYGLIFDKQQLALEQ